MAGGCQRDRLGITKGEGMTECLKPCPFCGSANLTTYTMRGKFTQYVVRCKDCDAKLFSNTPNMVVAKWNHRAERIEIERKKGKWLERSVHHGLIEDLQQAKCSVCGKYHTTPLLYFYDNYPYCPSCGSEMRSEE